MNVNIFGKTYRVQITKQRPSGVADVNYKDRLIRIQETKDRQYFDECLVHEMGHATVERLGIHNAKLSSDLEEIICDAFAKVITENFRLVRK